MFVHPGTSEIGVALQAGGSLLSDGGLKARFKRAVRIVTRSALDRAVIHFVMHWRGKLVLDLGVTLIAEGWLRRLQQLPFLA